MSTTDQFSRASRLYQQGQIEEALALLKQEVDGGRDKARCLTTMAAIYEARERNDEALTAYRSLLQLKPGDVRTLLRLGIVLCRLGLYKEALEPLYIAWQSDNRNARAASAYADALDELERHDEARAMYEEALRLDSGLSNARFNLGIILFNEGRFESAITHFVTYMVKVGENARAHRNIGRALEEMGQYDGAISSFSKAIKLEPDNAENYFDMALTYDMKDEPGTAITFYEKALEIRPEFIEARYNCAELLMRSGKTNEAIEAFQLILHEDPDNHLALNGISTCFINKRQFPTAIELLKRAISINPNYGLAHYNLGLAMREDGQVEAAIQHFQEAARLDPEDYSAVAAGELLIARKAIMSTQRHRPSARLSGKLQRLSPLGD